MMPTPNPLQLDPHSPVPLYRQLREALQGALAGGHWDADQPLPSERELSEQLQVSRATVRQAIHELELDGWLVRKQGRGTFPSPVRIEQPLARITSFSENMRQAGIKASSRILTASLEPAIGAVARSLRLGSGGVVASIVRLRLANDQPLMLERAHLNYALVPGILEHTSALRGSLYDLLHSVYRLNFATGFETIEAITADAKLAKVLEVVRGTPILQTERLVLTDDGTPLEFTQRYGRADRCSFRVNLQGDNANFAYKQRH